MFQKFALAFKAKTFEFFTNKEVEDADGLSLLDFAEEIGKSKVFEPNPFVEDSIKAANRALVSHLQRLSEFKRFYVDFCRNTEFDSDLPIGSCLEAQVEENQSKLRTLGIKLDEIHKSNLKLSKRLSGNLGSSCDFLLSVKVFDSLLHDACRLAYKFTKILIEWMRKAGWDLDLALNLVHPNIDYAKKAHYRYTLLSYVSLRIFWGFNSKHFGESENGALSNGHVSDSNKKSTSLKQLLEHVSSNPLELLSREPSCEFSKFCESKYQEIIHPKVCFLTIKAKVENGSIVYLLIFGGCFSVDDRNLW
ncbi:hypothetical protein UlMin_003372 [Ulmus minor]